MFAASSADACEESRTLSAPEQKESRDMLLNPSADPLDRLAAFRNLACSNDPVIKNYAIREGLKTAADPLVREQILLAAMLQKTRVDVELFPNSDLSDQDKKFAKQNSNLLSYEVRHASPKEGCLGFYRRDSCTPSSSLYLRGDKAELTISNLIGEFRLTDSNELAGFVLPRKGFGRIPALIKLY
jgi:hypothetical protein